MQALVLRVERHWLNEDSGVQVDRVTQADSICDDDTVHEHGQTRSKASLIVQDVSSDPSVFPEVQLQDLADRVAKHLQGRAGYVVLNKRSKDHGCHEAPLFFPIKIRKLSTVRAS
jgi:hypothetical protein